MDKSKNKKVLIAEKISPEAITMLEERFMVDPRESIPREELLGMVGNYDALIVRSGTKVDHEVIERAKKLRIIGRAGIGVDNIDLNAATRRGIIVANVPESNAISAAEHTMAMLLALVRKIPQAYASLSRGEWKRSEFQGVELYGKTLGIIGLGRIGPLVAERAMAFGMKIVGYDPFISAQRANSIGVELLELDEVLAQSDFITLHVPKTDETFHMMDAERISKMRKGAMIINVSRGGVMDEDALAEAIKSGQISGAAIDVFEKEPPGDSELLKLEQVIATPHLGASTAEAQYKAGVAIAEQIIAGLEKGFVS
ncbi:MAG: phosphoglycerate dehydrogenase [Actinomycetota bacterium]|nr:phosphoglycerate dehydrogenase [Actinomycetota bacterium]